MARFRRYGYRKSRSTNRSAERSVKPPRFPKGTLADWEIRFAQAKRLLGEVLAKEAAIQTACMPLRKRYAEVRDRLHRLWVEERRAKDAFFGLGSFVYQKPVADEAEYRRLLDEQSQLVSRIIAIAGDVQWERSQWGGQLHKSLRSYDKGSKAATPLDRPLDTPHSRDIVECQKQLDRIAGEKPTLEEDAACRQDREEQRLRAERKSQREAAKVDREAARKRKAEADQAAVASALGKARDHAENVKRALRKDHDCPYCGNGLGAQPHADHIYPVSKGGRSVSANMVYVCAVCNVKKGDMTLAAFIATQRLDRDVIEQRLQRLRKEY